MAGCEANGRQCCGIGEYGGAQQHELSKLLSALRMGAPLTHSTPAQLLLHTSTLKLVTPCCKGNTVQAVITLAVTPLGARVHTADGTLHTSGRNNITGNIGQILDFKIADSVYRTAASASFSNWMLH